MRRRIFLLVLIVSMLGACLCGCSSTSETEKDSPTSIDNTEKLSSTPKEISIWLWEDEEGVSKFLEDDWNSANDDIKVNLEVVGYDVFHDKLITAISSGSAPDGWEIITGWLRELVNMDAVLPLNDYVNSWELKDEIVPSVLDISKVEDIYYGVPYQNCSYYIYVNKQLFEDAGVKYPGTIGEFYEACDELTRDTNGDGVIDTYGWGMRGARNGHAMWSSIVFTDAGTGFLDAKENSMLLTEEVIAANERYINLFKNGHTPATAPNDGMSEIVQNFKSGITAMLEHHVMSSAGMVDALGENVDVIEIPRNESGYRFIPCEPCPVVINSKTEHPDEAFKYFAWYSSHDCCDKINSKLGQIPATKSVMDLPYYTDNKFMKLSMDVLPEAIDVPKSMTWGEWAEVTWPQTFQRALMGEIDSAEMMKVLNDKLVEGMK
jgi:multiple sugar transport system substrate-binding protein